MLTINQNAINTYHRQMGYFPNNILLYRDGVSEGEYAQLEQGEIMEIESMENLNVTIYDRPYAELSRRPARRPAKRHQAQAQARIRRRRQEVHTLVI